MSQSELEVNTCNRHQARENACGQVTIGSTFVSHWLRKWREFLLTITDLCKQNHSKRLIVFDAQLKSVLKAKTVIGQL